MTELEALNLLQDKGNQWNAKVEPSRKRFMCRVTPDFSQTWESQTSSITAYKFGRNPGLDLVKLKEYSRELGIVGLDKMVGFMLVNRPSKIKKGVFGIVPPFVTRPLGNYNNDLVILVPELAEEAWEVQIWPWPPSSVMENAQTDDPMLFLTQ
ncbi:MAG TPA: hypothetical protein VLE93_02805 [Candidatus Saccharimonadales bacterium]|nr:hypothetical protein [Candidatus Saccharimonadales bacterium]